VSKTILKENSIMQLRKLLTLLVAVLALVPLARAEAACSTATLSGSYAASGTGEVFGGTPIASAVLFKFDGKGGLGAKGATSSAGTGTPGQVWTGTYAVKADCSFTYSITEKTGAVSTAMGAVSDAGRHLVIMDTTANRYLRYNADRLAVTSCSAIPAASYVGEEQYLYTPYGLRGGAIDIGTGDASGNYDITKYVNLEVALVTVPVPVFVTLHPDCTIDSVDASGTIGSFGVVILTPGRIEQRSVFLLAGWTGVGTLIGRIPD
jgi:hypothetical protein